MGGFFCNDFFGTKSAKNIPARRLDMCPCLARCGRRDCFCYYIHIGPATAHPPPPSPLRPAAGRPWCWSAPSSDVCHADASAGHTCAHTVRALPIVALHVVGAELGASQAPAPVVVVDTKAGRCDDIAAHWSHGVVCVASPTLDLVPTA